MWLMMVLALKLQTTYCVIVHIPLVAGPVQSKVKTLVLVSDLWLHQPATAYFMPKKIDVTFI